MPRHQLYSRTVSPQTRMVVQCCYPALDQDMAYWWTMHHLAFGHLSWNGHRQQHELVFSCDIVAAITGRSYKHASSTKWLSEFERVVGIPLQIRKHSYSTGEATAVDPLFDPRVRDAIRLVPNRPDATVTEPWVDFVTGEVPDPRRRRRERKKQHEETKAEAARDAAKQPTFDLLQLLHSPALLDLECRLADNWDGALDLYDAMPEGKAKDATRRIIQAMHDDPTILYHSVDNSPRLFAAGNTLNHSPREIRTRFLSGDVFLDLQRCQLAIVSEIWDLPTIKHYLERLQHEGTSFWKDFIGGLNLEVSEAVKDAVKQALYSTLFGMGKRKIKNGEKSSHGGKVNGLKELLGEEAAGLFMNHWLIKMLLDTRAKVYDKIGEAGGADDAFNRWIPMSEDRKPHQIACEVVQSYEVRLMLSLLPTLLQHRDTVVIHSWLHDGMALSFTDPSKEEAIQQQMKADLEAEAWRLKIPTTLEIKR